MENFTPLSAAVGGFLIGLAAVLFMALNGRIAGISGILKGAIASSEGAGPGDDRFWRLAFIAGLFASPLTFWIVTGARPEIIIDNPLWLTAVAGLLVGFGTALGSGCTSGHGVCGMARFSKRSVVATLTFMGVGIAAVLIRSLLLGESS